MGKRENQRERKKKDAGVLSSNPIAHVEWGTVSCSLNRKMGGFVRKRGFEKMDGLVRKEVLR